MNPDALAECIAELITRPGHEKVRTLVQHLLVQELNAQSTLVTFEERLPVVHGRLDALLGYTVLEFKSNLSYELGDAERQMADYIEEKQRQTGHRHVGIVTDGKEFRAYQLLAGRLHLDGVHQPTIHHPRETVAWLDSVLCLRPDLPPDPWLVKIELGRYSMAWKVASKRLAGIWERLQTDPEALLKRRLWADLLARVYGNSIDSDDLFFQHTYLSTISKTIAMHVVGLAVPAAADLLSGKPFVQAGITGAVESDFFDWPLRDPEGPELIRDIAIQTGRFRFAQVETDVLKGLYESLIDPEQRHELGEYYTPDWLAAKVCAHAIDDPLNQRILDPACGSGTFLFHAVRRLLAAADVAKLSNRDAIALCIDKVLGIEIHPLAVQIARVTYLLAIGTQKLQQDRDVVAIPVYMGDSLQWNTHGFFDQQDLSIEVPGEGLQLEFPLEVTAQPDVFDRTMQTMVSLGESGADGRDFERWLAQNAPLTPAENQVLVQTYEKLKRLHAEGKNHIWAFVARNLSRPVWLSRTASRPDRIVGNPPWLSYRHMSAEMQRRVREDSQEKHIWVGGKVATHQDLSAYFLARCTELYFRPETTLAFVMPYAVMSRQAYQGLRKGEFGNRVDESGKSVRNAVTYTEAWTFPDLQPLFPVPSCVLFCRNRLPEDLGPLPSTVHRFEGSLPHRDANLELIADRVSESLTPWPTGDSIEGGSPYRDRFRQGATIVPRMLSIVERVPPGPLGSNPDAPLVVSRKNNLEKPPWRDLEALRGNIEIRFLMPLLLGESIVPFRALDPQLAIIPWDGERLLDAQAAQRRGYLHLAQWISRAEAIWNRHRSRSADLTLIRRWDFHSALEKQFPISPLRVVYAASGSNPTATILKSSGPIESSLYFASIDDEHEAYYLVAILNSEALRRMIASRQASGQFGARHFHKLVFSVPIEPFDPTDTLHASIADQGQRAEAIAKSVDLSSRINFIAARRKVRTALIDSGISAQIDTLVEELLTR